MTPVDDDVRAALDGWRDELLDLSGANRLINLRPDAPGALEIAGPSPKSLVEALRQGDDCGFAGAEGVPEELDPRPALTLRTRVPEEIMRPVLHRLEVRAREEFLDRGVATLHLGIGLLHWQDETGPAHASPILLLPVELVGHRLRIRGEDPVINPALTLRLRRLGIELPVAGPLGDLDVTVLWARLDVAISDYRWLADETIVLSRFTLHREAAYQDLTDQQERVLTHPIVRALAVGDRDELYDFTPIPPDRIDEHRPPEEVPLLLDADADQRACVAAAVEGRSFVIDGPPGTGKTQTIANMVGCLLHAGKRVLVVSERAAALDTVRERLDAAGLGDYLLALHSHTTGRAEVASALAAALDTEPPPLAGVDPVDRRAVRERRERLQAYADAMNRIHRPIGRSLHEVLGICAGLIEVPAAPVPSELPPDLSPTSFERVRQAVADYAATWRDAYLWRDVIDREPLGLRLRRAQLALEGLAEVAEQNAPLAEAFDLHEPADAGTLAALVGHAARRPPHVHEDWLTMRNLQPVQRAIDELTRHLAALEYQGVAWSELPSAADLGTVPDLYLDPPALDLRPLIATQAEDLARKFTDDADVLEQHQENLARVTARLGLPNVVSFPDTARVVALADLIGRPHKPEASWFEPGGLARAREGAAILRTRVADAEAAETEARQHFREEALDEPVDELAERFATRHRGARKLFGSYRRDKKAAAEVALPTVKPADAVARLDTAAAWKQASDALEAASLTYGELLGRYYQGRDTDFAALEEALRTAAEGIETTPAEALPAVAVHLSAARPNNAMLRIVGEARTAFSTWIAKLYPPPANAARPELAEGSIQGAIAWLRAHIGPLTKAAELIRAYSGPTGRRLTLGEAMDLSRQREAAAEAEAAIWRNAASHAALLGTGYRGTKTNVKALADIAEWTAEARRLRTGNDEPLTDKQAHALSECWPSTALADAVADWQEARGQLMDAFAPVRRGELSTLLDDYDQAHRLLGELLADEEGQHQWFSHADAGQIFTDHGLDAAVDFCAAEGIVPAAMWPVLERALYRGWADAVLRDDPDLSPLGAEDRNHLVEEYHLLDQELTAGALADIVVAVENRRGGPTEVVRREGNKHLGHLPVRDLIALTRTTVLGLKPCFLMSPYAVSALLPPDIGFDVVIVDEGSRLTPADALPAILRGAALIVAGDERQLPPTSFYERPEDTPTDATSLLEPARRAFAVLPLNTHYRSRHEGLMAFADHAYYQGALTIFPRADVTSPDMGVAFFPIDGVYRRETARDNPIEAAAVAERVLHHLKHRPGQTLGVVTLSTAQAEAIRDALEWVIEKQPQYAGLFEGDRTTGFFVKSVEAAQGDERDVIILSVGYGYDEHDKISTNLGALTRPKGWRRLNVAISRARRLVEVVSSLRADDVPDLGNETVRHLKAYLDYAEHGAAALLGSGSDQASTALEQSVMDAIRSWGFGVRARVGTAGHTVDLAVRHPDRPDEVYVLGVECDGPAYRAVPAVRDRDRVREQVLRDRGWTLYRVWSTAWYRNRHHEESRLLGAIERAIEGPSHAPRHAAELPHRPEPYRRVERELFGEAPMAGPLLGPAPGPVLGPVLGPVYGPEPPRDRS
jgi:very-short-patch-repair endonuclease